MLEGALSGPIETKCLMYVNVSDLRSLQISLLICNDHRSRHLVSIGRIHPWNMAAKQLKLSCFAAMPKSSIGICCNVVVLKGCNYDAMPSLGDMCAFFHIRYSIFKFSLIFEWWCAICTPLLRKQHKNSLKYSWNLELFKRFSSKGKWPLAFMIFNLSF